MASLQVQYFIIYPLNKYIVFFSAGNISICEMRIYLGCKLWWEAELCRFGGVKMWWRVAVEFGQMGKEESRVIYLVRKLV